MKRISYVVNTLAEKHIKINSGICPKCRVIE
ncbi:MAG: hypothetical protein ACI8WT_003437, partial [Clostridium sp.]